jgi:transposase
VYEKDLSVRAAALQLQIKPRTARYWVQQDQKEPTDQIVKKVGGGRPTGRSPKLVEEHRQFLIDLIDEKLSLVLDEIVTSLMEQFAGFNIKKSALHDFMTEKCKISLKRAHLQPVERNSPEKNKNRHAWVTKWLQMDMDYLGNCVFIDEAAFYVNMKRSYA